MRRSLCLPLFAAFAAGCVALGGRSELDAALGELLLRPELAGGRIGVCVVDAGSGERLAAADDDRGFATASNMKLLATAVAFATLGPEHRFVTELWQRGTLDDGVLSGELILRGHGDPSFGSPHGGRDALGELVQVLQQRGVHRVVGRIVGDDRWLGTEHLGQGWQWDYLDEDYAAPFGALCCAGNVVTVTVQPGPGGPLVSRTPDVGPPLRVMVRQLAAEGDAATQLEVHRALGSDDIEVQGTIRADSQPQHIEVPVREPAVFAAMVLRERLVAAGIAVDEQPDVVVAGDEKLVAAVSSLPLGELAPHLLQQSDNLWAEQFLRSSARIATGDGSTAAAARHATAVLAQWGIDTRGIVIADGSGLSRRNLVQPRQLVGVLAAMWRSPHRDLFVQALPLAGRIGTLRARFADGPASGRVRAKTGFLSRVVCLSGFVPRPDPQAAPWLFSVMLNDFPCSDADAKAAIDAFVQRLAASAGW